MIEGTVSSNLLPIIKLDLLGANHRRETIEAAIDSGFNGELTVPAFVIDLLDWPFKHSERTTLADGNEVNMPVYKGIVYWKDRPRIVDVYASSSGSLVGLSLLDGNEVWIQVKRGGMVIISELSSDSIGKLQTQSKPIIGLVGGLGSGKSRVAAAFHQHGGVLITADALGHEALEQPDILARVAQRWGARVVDEKGIADRKRLGAIVFASPVERANLELLVFPWIEGRIREQIAKAQADPKIPFVVLDAAIMLEAGWNNVCDRIVYVHAPRAVRLERLLTYRGWSAVDVANREAAQLPLAIKASRAHVAVDNSGSVEKTQEQVDTLVRMWSR